MYFSYNGYIFKNLIELEDLSEEGCVINIIKSNKEIKDRSYVFNSQSSLIEDILKKITEKIEAQKSKTNLKNEINNINKKLENKAAISKMIPFFNEKRHREILDKYRRKRFFLEMVEENNVAYFYKKIIFSFETI